jgi:hypothetical protein
MHAAATLRVRLTKARSLLTNDPRRLAGVSMKSAAGRRYRDIVELLIVEFGTGDLVRVRELAGLKYSQEQVQALVVGGEQRAVEDLVRLSNLIARRENELRTRKAAAVKPDTRPLHQRLADLRPARAAPEAKGVA